MGKTRIIKMLEILDQMAEVLGLYGSVVLGMADPQKKEAIIEAVGLVDDMIFDMRVDLEEMKARQV